VNKPEINKFVGNFPFAIYYVNLSLQ